MIGPIAHERVAQRDDVGRRAAVDGQRQERHALPLRAAEKQVGPRASERVDALPPIADEHDALRPLGARQRDLEAGGVHVLPLVDLDVLKHPPDGVRDLGAPPQKPRRAREHVGEVDRVLLNLLRLVGDAEPEDVVRRVQPALLELRDGRVAGGARERPRPREQEIGDLLLGALRLELDHRLADDRRRLHEVLRLALDRRLFEGRVHDGAVAHAAADDALRGDLRVGRAVLPEELVPERVERLRHVLGVHGAHEHQTLAGRLGGVLVEDQVDDLARRHAVLHERVAALHQHFRLARARGRGDDDFALAPVRRALLERVELDDVRRTTRCDDRERPERRRRRRVPNRWVAPVLFHFLALEVGLDDLEHRVAFALDPALEHALRRGRALRRSAPQRGGARLAADDAGLAVHALLLRVAKQDHRVDADLGLARVAEAGPLGPHPDRFVCGSSFLSAHSRSPFTPRSSGPTRD